MTRERILAIMVYAERGWPGLQKLCNNRSGPLAAVKLSDALVMHRWNMRPMLPTGWLHGAS